MARSTSKDRRRTAEKEASEALKARAEYLRHRKAQGQRRALLLTLLPILGLIAAWLGYGVFREAYWEPRQPVARVEGQAVSANDYGKRVQYARRQMLGNLSNLLGMISTSDASFITQYASGQRTSLPDNTLNTMIDEVLIRKEAERRGITVTDEDVDARIRKDLTEALNGPAAVATESTDDAANAGDESPDAGTAPDDEAAADTAPDDGAPADEAAEAASDDEAPAEGAVDTAADDAADTASDDEAAADASADEGESTAGDDEATDAEAEPTVAIETSDAEIDRAFDRLLKPMLTDAGMSRKDYEELIRAQLYSEKLGEALGEEIPTTAKQVEADYLLFTTEADAEAALAALDAGASWSEAVAQFQQPAEGAIEDAGADAAADDAAAAPADEPADEPATAAVDATDAITDAEGSTGTVDATGAITATDGLTDTDTADLADGDAEAPEADAAPDGPVYAVEVGELRWYTADTLVERLALTQADADAVLLLDAGATSEGLTGSRGTYILHVSDKDDARPLEEADLQALKDGALEKWLTEQRTAMSGEINRFPLTGLVPEEPQWFITQYDQLVGGVSSQVPLELPTVAVSPGDGG